MNGWVLVCHFLVCFHIFTRGISLEMQIFFFNAAISSAHVFLALGVGNFMFSHHQDQSNLNEANNIFVLLMRMTTAT